MKNKEKKEEENEEEEEKKKEESVKNEISKIKKIMTVSYIAA